VLPAVIPIALAQFESELINFHLQGVWHFRGIAVFFSDAAQLFMAASLGLLLLRPLLLSVCRQRVMALDLKQAQEVQRVLMPKEQPPIAGLAIETEYRPAREVGGDFFQIVEHLTVEVS
jgi:hypothetical protein